MKKTKYVARVPRTAEEREHARRRNLFIRPALIIHLLFFILIFIFVPKEPNTTFYLALNDFLDSYLFGDILPDFSDKFYFSMKVAWCSSFLCYLEFMFVSILFVGFCLGRNGLKTLHYFG